MRACGVLAVEIVGGGCAEHLVRFVFKVLVERLDLVADGFKAALVVGALVGVCHVIVGRLGAIRVVFVRNGKQPHLGKGAACLDNVDRLAVGSRHLLVKVDVLVACDKDIDATEPRGKGLCVERVRDTHNNIAALLAQLLCLGIDGVRGTREAGARDQVRAQRGT